ncbi:MULTISPECIES: M23 family metallopeptidase [Lactobacillus]|uniref:M23 family metallopeptidase n=1 Tax=Lactobacillus xujianguonis TaxID=2495899 RepID=A0A437STE5_9LACO|nr:MULTISPECIES: M23 family metallopeptidase [Lactobacillus]RVU70209.1 M23 family metallopeptidase [Lactobacillus xujianguonis]RVU73393.1 M23 family metallopeptidase [Lactobacillus xujianguonis]
MKKKFILASAALVALSSSLLFGSNNTQAAKKKNADIQTEEVDPSIKNDWNYPFAVQDKKGVRPMYNAQVFGITNYARSIKPLSYFHDGWDFGFSEVGHSTVRAVHPGTVKKVAYGNGLGWFVWVISPDNYVQIYQEGFNKKKDIKVKAGQMVKTGQKIGKLTGSHLHLGVTKTNHDYINDHGYPCNNWFRNVGTWLNPVKTIEENCK